jgi:hypothetical protein
MMINILHAIILAAHYFISSEKLKKIWLDQAPHTLIMKPATELFSRYQKYVLNISNAGNLSEEKKILLDEYTCHFGETKDSGTKRALKEQVYWVEGVVKSYN